jgi:hypothetical protein
LAIAHIYTGSESGATQSLQFSAKLAGLQLAGSGECARIMTLLRSLQLATIGLLAAGCADGCPADRALTVGGATPFVRCLAAEPPPARVVRVGSAVLEVRNRELSITGLGPVVRLAAFSGPAFFAAPGPGELSALRAASPNLLLLLGDLGDQPATAQATVARLSDLRLPTLVLAGGRDTWRSVGDALGSLDPARPWLLDITALEAVHVGGVTLIPVAGAREGHYARTEQSCGYARKDVARIAGRLTAIGSAARIVVGWEAPEFGGRSAPDVVRELGAAAGLFAWPVGPPWELGEPAGVDPQAAPISSVPRLGGAVGESLDGARIAAGFSLFQLEAGRLKALGGPGRPFDFGPQP